MTSPGMDGMTDGERARLRAEVRAELGQIEGVNPLDKAPTSPRLERLKRRGMRPATPASVFTLVESGGVLTWEEGYGLSPAPGLRRGLRGTLPRGEIIERVQADPLPLGNQVTEFLMARDRTWTPDQGLREWTPAGLGPPLKADQPALKEGRALVIIHGTFSSSDALLAEINATVAGQTFLARASKGRARYNKIYAFSHPTVSVSPVMNAVDLARHFRGSKAAIDVIAHSRGGLVARWWLEAMPPLSAAERRLVLVGCPLDGTSLATPLRLRDALSWLTNVHHALAAGAGLGATLIPFLSVVSGLLRIAASITTLATKTPAVDAAISVIPGLSAMTRVNPELMRLNVVQPSQVRYWAVQSDFDPDPIGLKVWKFITEARIRAASASADAVFPGKHDLVVDTESMTHLAGEFSSPGAVQIPTIRCHDFGTQALVHHTNYFRQASLYKFLQEAALKAPVRQAAR